MFKLSFGVIVFFVAHCIFFAVECCAQLDRPTYAFSENREILVEISPLHAGAGTPCRLIVHKWAENESTYLSQSSVLLSQPWRPHQFFVCNDGRLLAAFYPGNSGDPSLPIVELWDTVSDTHRVYRVEDLFDPTELPTAENNYSVPFVQHVPMYGLNWLDRRGQIYESDRQTLFVSGINVEKDARRLWFQIELQQMTIERATTTPWMEHLNMAWSIDDRHHEEIGRTVNVEHRNWLQIAKRQASRPAMQLSWRVDERLFAVVPGDGERNAELWRIQRDRENADRLERFVVPLRNRTAPLDWVISDGGRYFITLDDWEVMGSGPNVVVIYDMNQSQSKSFALEDFMTPEDIKNLFSRNENRMWRALGANAWISYLGDEFSDFRPQRCLDLFPHVTIDPDSMSVISDSPFQSKYEFLREQYIK